MPLTDAGANLALNAILGDNRSSAAPATLYVALSSTTPTAAGGNVTEPSGGAYARVAVTNNNTNFPSAASRAKSNGATITFPTATVSWGVLTHAVLYDASSGGNAIAYAQFSSALTVFNGTAVQFSIGSLTFSVA